MSAIMRAASWMVWSGRAMLTLRVIASLTLIFLLLSAWMGQAG